MSEFAALLFIVLLGTKYSFLCCVTFDGSMVSSQESLEELIRTEKTVIEAVENYLSKMESRWSLVTRMAARYRAENEKANRDPEGYLSIPTNAFALIHRIYRTWPRWQLYVRHEIGHDFTDFIEAAFPNLPSELDFNETIAVFSRIKDIYGLRVADLAVGNINGEQYDARLSALDCYTMGFELFRKREYSSAAEWLSMALELYQEEPINRILQFTRIKVLAVYAETLRKQHRTKDAMNLVDTALAIEPTNAGLLRKKRQLEIDLDLFIGVSTLHAEEQPNDYTLGCRGEFPYRAFDLYCLYDTETTSFLKLAPFKKEILSIDPYVALFYDAITDKEIDNLKNVSRPKLARSNTAKPETKQYRSLNITFLAEDAHNVTSRLNRRISDMSGFELNVAEPLEIQVYGIGGHYGFNDDLPQNIPRVSGPEGDRLATALFYLTDVKQGGATVFPYKQIAIFPKKGTAVLWHNLDSRMKPDNRIMHGACPVLLGIKWSAEKSIYERR